MARLFIVIPGSIGLLLVGRAITLYSRQDRLAFGLAILIGVGLLAGLVELALRLRRAEALRKEVEGLPSPATEETVAQTSPLLGAWLRAAIAQVSPPPAPVPVTPYLLGLLVMMGLLGTFLGLFETLQSARAVLTSTAGDVELLRTGMAAPMIGLSRAFGTSAAGVSASASLGLAAVFVRRMEAQAAAAVAAYIAGPLRGLTPEVRKVVVMERLAQECEALPKAAMALHEAVSRLSGLEQTMAAAQEKAAEQTAQAMAQTALALREELARTAGASAAAVASVMEPRLDAMTRAVAVAMGGEVQRFLASQESKLVQMDQWLEARHESDGKHASQLAALVEAQRQGEVAAAERLEALAEARRISDLAHAKALTEALEASLQREQARWEAAAERDEAARRAQNERDEAARRAQNERDEARRLAQAELEASQRQEHERHMAELVGEQRSQWNAMVAKFDELTMAREREGLALSEKLAALGQARKDSDLAFESQLARMVETRQQQELAFEERLRSLDNQLQSASQQELERLSQLGERLVEGAAVGAVRVKELLERMASEAEKQWAVHGVEHRARSEELKATLDAFARAADQVQASAQARADEVIAAVSGHAESAAGATAAQVRALGEALTVHAEGLATAAQEQIRTLNEAVQAGVERMAAASNTATVDLLAAARENTEAMAERMVALEARVDESRVAAADLLAGKLADHAKGVGDELTAIVASLVEATDLVKAGGAEMQAVAEMFLGAVDKYREANDQWMETLGKIEDTLAKEAREEAGDLLGDYIEQSRELFDQSLQFQRELFSEFRALRQSRDSMVVPAAGE